MKLVDSNVWVAIALDKHTLHHVAKAWLDFESVSKDLLFCRATQQSFLRLLSTPAVTKQYGMMPFTNAEAWALYEHFLADPRIATVDEPPGLEAQWKAFAGRTTTSPKLWMDGYLASFAMTGGYQFVTTDQAFRQFAGLNLLLLPPTI